MEQLQHQERFILARLDTKLAHGSQHKLQQNIRTRRMRADLTGAAVISHSSLHGVVIDAEHSVPIASTAAESAECLPRSSRVRAHWGWQWVAICSGTVLDPENRPHRPAAAAQTGRVIASLEPASGLLCVLSRLQSVDSNSQHSASQPYIRSPPLSTKPPDSTSACLHSAIISTQHSALSAKLH